jgi:hypothetical protein
MMLLRALAVGVEEMTLGFAEEEDGSGSAIGLQRDAGVCFVVMVHARAEDGIEAWQLAEGWLKLSLSEPAAATLGVHRDVLIQFAPVHTDEVRAALARILGRG